MYKKRPHSICDKKRVQIYISNTYIAILYWQTIFMWQTNKIHFKSFLVVAEKNRIVRKSHALNNKSSLVASLYRITWSAAVFNTISCSIRNCVPVLLALFFRLFHSTAIISFNHFFSLFLSHSWVVDNTIGFYYYFCMTFHSNKMLLNKMLLKKTHVSRLKCTNILKKTLNSSPSQFRYVSCFVLCMFEFCRHFLCVVRFSIPFTFR